MAGSLAQTRNELRMLVDKHSEDGISDTRVVAEVVDIHQSV